MAAGKSWQEKAEEACANCQKCHGNFPLNPNEMPEPDLIAEIIEDIKRLYDRDRAGCKFDYNGAEYVKGSLFMAFAKAVREVEQFQQSRLQIFLKGWLKG
ncbi:MAG TPA: hypothetical protein PKY82_18995 [Pyrinomonadaceae bacterium]|nr:hypothetical protein [Pyrinomonadaceae bacterium]